MRRFLRTSIISEEGELEDAPGLRHLSEQRASTRNDASCETRSERPQPMPCLCVDAPRHNRMSQEAVASLHTFGIDLRQSTTEWLHVAQPLVSSAASCAVSPC